MATKPVRQVTIADKLIERWEQVGKKLAALAEAFPASKFDYRPTQDVRTVAEVVRHVAFWNYYVADSARGRKADDQANELPQDKFSTRAQILEALKQSTAAAAEALKERSSSMSPETAEMAVAFIEHISEHYGQLAIYARLNAIIPPVSRA